MRRVFLFIFAVSLQGCVMHAVSGPMGNSGTPRQDPPPGMVELDVVSDREDQVWDVYSGSEVVCSTPCTRLFQTGQDLFVESRDGDAVFVPDVGVDSQQRHAMVVAEGTSYGKQVNGIVFTTLGGMGVVTAITLTAVGCSDLQERAGMCNAGLITGAVSLPLTAVAIWMLVDSNPKAHVLPVFESRARNGQPPVRVAVAPNGVVGTF
jgi:hypothetical protein